MIYGVTFEKGGSRRHTYNDWGLLQVYASDLTPPEVQEHYIQIPGMDGAIDATEALDGFVHYETREFRGTYKCIAPRSEWKKILGEMARFLHGKSLHATLDDDTRHYVSGRFRVGEPEYDKAFFTVDLTGTVEPYRYLQYDTIGDWDWDPFEFAEDVAWDYKDIEVVESTDVIVYATELPVTPTFTCSSAMTLSVNGRVFNLPSGVSVAPNLIIKDGTYTFRFTGDGTVSILFKGGEL